MKYLIELLALALVSLAAANVVAVVLTY